MSITPDVQNRVTLRPVTDAKVQVQDNGADQIGRGLQGLAAGVAKAADNFQAINDIHDEAAVKNADTMAMQEASALSRQIKNTRGEQALLAGEMFEDELQSIRERQLGRLKNDRQKRMFTDVFDRRAIADTETVNAHLDKETRTYAVDAAAGRAKTAGEYAVDNVDNPIEFDKAVLTVVSEVRAANGLIGADKDMADRATASAVSGVYTSAVEKIRVEQGALAAEEFANKHASKISPDQETDLRARMAPAVREARADNRAGSIIAKLQGGEYGNAIEGAAIAGEADPAKAEENTTKAADPLRGKGGASQAVAPVNTDVLKGKGLGEPKGGSYGANRDGGKRKHGGRDIAAPAGTPVYPATNGKVVEVDTEGKTIGGYYVKVQYPDGHTDSFVHLRNVNVKVGDNVTINTVVGGVGGTGRGGKQEYGNHLHRTVRGPDGKTIDPNDYKPSGVTVAETSPGYVPKYDGERVNLEGAYADVRKQAKEEGWSETEIRDVYQRIDEFAARQDKVRDRRYDDAAEAASQQMTELIKSGTPLTNPAQQISNFGDLDPKMQMQMESNAASNRQVISNEAIALAEAQAREAADDNVDTVSLLDHQITTKPGEFMQVDLAKYKGLIPKSDYERLRKEQSELRVQGVQRPELDPKRSQADTAVKYALGAALIDPEKLKDPKSLDSQRYAWLLGAALKGIEVQQQQLGRPLSEAEIEKNVMGPLLRPVLLTTPGFFGNDVTKMPWYIAKRKGAKAPDLYNN